MDDVKDIKKEFLGAINDIFDTFQKGANLLLVAHGAALLACLTQLKEYDSNIKLRGLGIFICAFAVGFICAVLGYVLTARSRWALIVAVEKGEKAEMNADGLTASAKWLFGSTIMLLLPLLDIMRDQASSEVAHALVQSLVSRQKSWRRRLRQ